MILLDISPERTRPGIRLARANGVGVVVGDGDVGAAGNGAHHAVYGGGEEAEGGLGGAFAGGDDEVDAAGLVGAGLDRDLALDEVQAVGVGGEGGDGIARCGEGAEAGEEEGG